MTNENRKDEVPRSFLAQWATNTVPVPVTVPPLPGGSDFCARHGLYDNCLVPDTRYTVSAYSHAERVLALDIFRDMRGVTADPEREPEAWTASLEYAREELARDRYEMDQQERTGAPYPEGD